MDPADESLQTKNFGNTVDSPNPGTSANQPAGINVMPAQPAPTPSSPDPLPPSQLPAAEQARTFLADSGNPIPWQKFLLAFFVVLLVVGSGLAVWRFFLPRFNKPPEITLTYWGLFEEESVLNEAISDYQVSHPNVKVVYSRQSQKDYRERLQSALAREEGPDIFRFHNTWVPMLKNELASLPSAVMDSASFEAAFYPVARNDLRVNNVYVGLPLEFDGLGLFVNEEIFNAAGKPFPQTWDELRQTALQLTVRESEDNIQVAGVALGRTENIDHWSDILALMMLQNGVDFSRPMDNLAEDALSYFSLFSQADRVWDKTLPASTLAFAGGKLAMYFGPSWRVFEIKKLNPQLSFQVIPVPQLQGTNITWASYWVEGVSKKSKHQNEAWEFLKYLSSKETLEKLYQAAAKTRLFGEPFSRTEMAGELKDDQYVGAYLKQAPDARSWYLASSTFDNGIDEKIIKYFEDAVNAVNQGKTPKEALTTANQGVAQVLAQYGLSSSVVR